MDSWRRTKGEIFHQEVQGTRSHNRKPPLGSWQPRVPSWEKEFCSSVGLVPWCRVVEAKRYMHLYENVLQWNDSAGEEAFSNAKKRYWAQRNGVPCDISLPNPDEYIDEVDWDSNVDPELLLDLERGPKALIKEKNNDGVIFGTALVNQSFACKGWGDEWQEEPKLHSGPGVRTHDQNVNEWTDTWENCYGDNKVANDGWGDQWNESWGWNDQNDNDLKPEWNDGGDHDLAPGRNEDKNYHNLEKLQCGAPRYWNNINREATGLCSSKYKKARFRNHGWRHNRGVKRNNFAY